MNLYYLIWADCIKSIREKDKKNWKLKSIIAMSVPMMWNIALMMTVLQNAVLDYYFYKIKFISSNGYIGGSIKFIILYFLPCLLVNYILVFSNAQYKKIVKNYPYKGGELFASYLILSLLVPIIILLIILFMNGDII